MTGGGPLAVRGRFGASLLMNPGHDPFPATIAARACFDADDAARAMRRISGWPHYAPTPLHDMPALAARLGLGGLLVKDESRRLGLASFKALGAIYASVAEVARLLQARTGQAVADADLLAGRHADALAGVRLTCCTDGNHGFSVASAAARMGCGAVIYIPSGVSAAREAALRATGAQVIRVPGIYDEAYEIAKKAAAGDADALLISDSATPDYTAIPAACMAGYSVMVQEMAGQFAGDEPTHVMLPAGCGGMAAAVIIAFAQVMGARAPRAILVEPVTADCVFRSIEAGAMTTVGGDLETIMGGLSCAAVSTVAWPVLSVGAFACLRMEDAAAPEAMRLLANPGGSDPAIVSGETGAAGLAGLLALADDAGARARLGLDATARVLAINCEGATDPEMYRRIVGEERAAALGVPL